MKLFNALVYLAVLWLSVLQVSLCSAAVIDFNDVVGPDIRPVQIDEERYLPSGVMLSSTGVGLFVSFGRLYASTSVDGIRADAPFIVDFVLPSTHTVGYTNSYSLIYSFSGAGTLSERVLAK